MKLQIRFRPGDDVRALWMLALGVLLCGSFFVQTRYQTAIRAAHEHTETLYRQTVADMRIVREAASLQRVQARAERDLAHVSHEASLSSTTAELLTTLQRSAHAFDTAVLELRPGDPQPVTAERAAAGTGTLLPAPMTIRVRGKFRNVLRFVEDLSHHATLIQVSDTEMSLSTEASANDAEPRLDATIHATLYRLAMPMQKEVRVATAR